MATRSFAYIDHLHAINYPDQDAKPPENRTPGTVLGNRGDLLTVVETGNKRTKERVDLFRLSNSFALSCTCKLIGDKISRGNFLEGDG